MTGRPRRGVGWLARALVAGLVLAAPATERVFAQTLPTLAGPVNDLAGVIDPAIEAELDRRIRALQTATGDVVVVATVESIAPLGTIEEYAVRLFERAGIGTRKDDNGVLIVLALSERRVRIETGYGLEGVITDGFSGETIRQAMLPAFREGRFGEGLLDGTTRVLQRIADDRGVSLAELPQARSPSGGDGTSIQSVVFGLIVFFLIMNMLRRTTRRSSLGRQRGHTWSSWGGFPAGFGGGFGGGLGGSRRGGGFGGFGGFGGGRSGGGGASGGW